MTPLAIETAGLRKAFGATPVLDGIDLSVEAGTVFALLGPNGAGKTTLIRILATLSTPDSGRARVAGFDVGTQSEAVRASISLTGQSAAVDEVLTGEENLRMMGRLAGFTRAQAKQRSRQLLKQFDLEASAARRVRTYSGGMRRRLDIALSLVTTPPIIFLDEPTTGLDTRSRQELWRVIAGLAQQGITIFLTTQYLEEADQLADRIAVLDGGRIVAEGTPAELKLRVGGDTVELRDEFDALVRSVPTDGSADGLRAALDTLQAAGPIEGRIGIRKPTMDEVFLALTGQRASAPFAEAEADAELEVQR